MTRTSRSVAAAVTGRDAPASVHPRSVPILDEGEAQEQPFEEGAHDAIDPDLRYRLISETAFEFYRKRGFVDGYDLDDWLAAEAQVDHQILAKAD